MEAGFSYGVLAGVNAYGFFPSGTAPGPIDIRNINGYTFGTAPAGGLIGSVTISPGDVQQVELTSSATTIALSGSFGNPVFDTVISNVWGWGNTSTSRITPPRAGQRTRFFAGMSIASPTSGAQYLLQLNKTGSPLTTLASVTANGTKSITLYGEWRDVPNGTDYYKLQVYCDSGSSLTVTPGSLRFGAELIGT